MRRVILSSVLAIAAIGSWGTVRADTVPNVRIVNGIDLALPPGYQTSPNANIGCIFAAESNGGVLSTPAYGTVQCH